MQIQNGNVRLWRLSCSLPVSILHRLPHNYPVTRSRPHGLWIIPQHLHHLCAEYIQELNMHHGLYSAVLRSLQHYDRLQSHADAAASTAAPAKYTNSKVCGSITFCCMPIMASQPCMLCTADGHRCILVNWQGSEQHTLLCVGRPPIPLRLATFCVKWFFALVLP